MEGYNYPLDNYLYSQIQQSHHIPQFDPYTFNGSDFIGNIQASTFYPIKIIAMCGGLILNKNITFHNYQIFYLCQVLLVSLFVFLIALKYFKSIFAALLLSLIFTYNGFMQAQIQHFWFFSSITWFPIIFLGICEGIIKGRRLGIFIYVLGMSCLVLAGFPLLFILITLMSLACTLGYAFLMRRTVEIRKVFYRSIFGLVFCGLICMIQLLPALIDISNSVAKLFEPNFPIESLITIISPNYFGHLTGNFSKPWEITTTYYYMGVALAIGIFSWFFIFLNNRLRSKINLRLVYILLLAFSVSFVLVFTTMLVDIHNHVFSSLGILRPWMIDIFMVSVLCVILVYPISLFPAKNKIFLLVIVLIIFFCSIDLLKNKPSFYNTSPGNALFVEKNNSIPVPINVLGELRSNRNSILVNQSHLGGSFDNWPRMWGIRSLGGHDPVITRDFTRALLKGGIGVTGDRLEINGLINQSWLKNNGVGYFIDAPSDKLIHSNTKGMSLLYSNNTFQLWRLNNPIGLFSSNCAKINSYDYLNNSFKVKYHSLTGGCTIHSTTNYSKYWKSSVGYIVKDNNGLGFDIENINKGSGFLTLKYSNPFYEYGSYISGFSILLFTLILFNKKVFNSAVFKSIL